MELKRYYWLKLESNFFESDTISWLEEQENGIYYSNFYLKLCLKVLNTDGILVRRVGNVTIPYSYEKLSQITHIDLEIVKEAMNIFKKIGLIKIFEDGEIFIPGACEMVGSESDKAELMRKKGARDKTSKNKEGNIVTNMLPKCYREIEIDKEIDIHKDIDIHEEIDKETIDFDDIVKKEKSNSYVGADIDLDKLVHLGNDEIHDILKNREIIESIKERCISELINKSRRFSKTG